MKKLKPFIKAAFILIAFIIIFQKINIQELKNIKITSPFYLFLAFLSFNLSQIISALRVHTYLKNIKVTPTFKKQLMLYYVGMFYNTLLPGGIGGDAYKAYKFEKSYSQGYKKIIKALLIDRISGLFAIFILISALIFLSSFKQFVIFSAILLIVSPFILYFLHKYFFVEFTKSFLKNLFLSIVIQSLQALAFLFILFALNIHSHLIDFIVLFFISSIISVIPISVGGVGLRELTFLYGLDMLHLNATIGVVSAFLFFVISVISSAIGALFIKGVKNV
ncbi:lysylphosphatidylglycerol synthase transmembrane domain-containing protein [Caminibacter pacificus]|uniref:Flippase-like domain-containing protein n=1 Tax=Caminibacter pacificus TaxID=1424653 RepID=A0AAJ4RD86_9BACT|nr:lysylphosphatidylglycerol synthase transmembrane domain-containing protein [Caminibacter pacificus]NPA87622.1 flippase-like domain-containing protein [Campylobacterota bacterium]QCI27561.1 flippase-like domain-containing protein [Caminibacter pacificus]ROR40261.1 hypothetical protein EDC58_1251 [Caminibacter pacificus]